MEMDRNCNNIPHNIIPKKPKVFGMVTWQLCSLKGNCVNEIWKRGKLAEAFKLSCKTCRKTRRNYLFKMQKINQINKIQKK